MDRAVKYGDGLFETIRIANSKILFAQDHYQRLARGFDMLGLRPISRPEFIAIIQKYINEKSESNLRVRLTFFRLGAGLYTPQSTDWNYKIEGTTLASDRYQLNEKGLHVGLAQKVRLSTDQLSNLKTISALPYVVAGLEKKANNWDDCLLLNTNNDIAESIAANLFWWEGETLYTPPLSAGCIAGVMRKQILNIANRYQIPTKEKTCSTKDLGQAQAVFLTNVIQGIRWVKSIDGIANAYSAVFAREWTRRLNDQLEFYLRDTGS